MSGVVANAERLPLWAIFLVTCGGFGSIYFGLGALTSWLTGSVFPASRIGAAILGPPPAPGQVRAEIRASVSSIVIFGFYGIATIAMERAGLCRIHWEPRWWLVPVELLALAAWNDVHFYLCHRLLHTRWLYRNVHHVHHRSRTPTPWSTYSFHFVESAMLGSVMLFVLPLFDFDALAILLFPAVSLALNNLGHMHYDLAKERSGWHPLAASRRHALHHTKVAGNYGFLLPALDALLGTAIPVAPVGAPPVLADSN